MRSIFGRVGMAARLKILDTEQKILMGLTTKPAKLMKLNEYNLKNSRYDASLNPLLDLYRHLGKVVKLNKSNRVRVILCCRLP